MSLLCRAAVLLSLLCVPCWSAEVLYSNGGILGDAADGSYNLPALPQDGIFDTFSISSSATVTEVSNIGLWVVSGDTPLSLSWFICVSICVDSDGAQVGVLASGFDVSLSPSIVESGVQATSGPFDVYSAGFSVDNLDLSAGSYTLELYDGIDQECQSCNVGWDINGGPSTAYIGVTDPTPQPSNSFEVDSNLVGAENAPEPGTFWALGTGLLAIPLLTRRRIQKRLGGK